MHKVAHVISQSHLIEPNPSARVDHRKCDRRRGPEHTYKQTHTTHQTGYETVNSYLSLLLIIVRCGPPRKSDSSLCHFIVEQSMARESETAFSSAWQTACCKTLLRCVICSTHRGNWREYACVISALVSNNYSMTPTALHQQFSLVSISKSSSEHVFFSCFALNHLFVVQRP